jgi:hypothetical protein
VSGVQEIAYLASTASLKPFMPKGLTGCEWRCSESQSVDVLLVYGERLIGRHPRRRGRLSAVQKSGEAAVKEHPMSPP